MIKNMRCPACERRHKRSHEKRVGTKLAYSPECIKLPRHPYNRSWLKLRWRQIYNQAIEAA